MISTKAKDGYTAFWRTRFVAELTITQRWKVRNEVSRHDVRVKKSCLDQRYRFVSVGYQLSWTSRFKNKYYLLTDSKTKPQSCEPIKRKRNTGESYETRTKDGITETPGKKFIGKIQSNSK